MAQASPSSASGALDTQEQTEAAWRALAEAGDANAMYEVGRRLFFGLGEAPPDAAQALPWFLRAAEAGCVPAIKMVGRCHRNGWGTGMDEAEGNVWLRRAADQQDPFSLGHCLYFGVGCEADRAAAFVWDCKAAELGDSAGMNSVAYTYSRGEGTEVDKARAFQLYAAGAAQKDPVCLNNLACCYRDGDGVEVNEAEASKHFQEAIRVGDTRALAGLGRLYLASPALVGGNAAEAAVELFARGAARGDPNAMLSYAYAYYTGNGVERNPAQAAHWYRAAADKGDTTGMANLACLYRDGHGVPEDTIKSIEWFRKAAEGGRASAMASLGWFYEAGKGVEKNLTKAVEWYRKAAEAGDVVGMSNLGYSYANAQGVDRDYDEAIKWYRKAADKGYASAMNNVGFCYSHGRGVPQDHAEAAKWFEKAANANSPVAMNNLADCYARGHGVPSDAAAAARWYFRAGEYYLAANETKRAIEYFELAAKKDHIPAMTLLGRSYQKGYPDVPQNFELAARWFRLAATYDDPAAMYEMAAFLEAVLGKPKFRTEALRLYRAAAAKDHPLASESVQRLVRELGDLDAALEAAVLAEPTSPLPVLLMCTICQTNPRTKTMLPCGHFALCQDCAEDGRLIKCPFDKVQVEQHLTTLVVPNLVRGLNDGNPETPVLLCVVCGTEPRTRTADPCGHLVACDSCAIGLVWCPYEACRLPVSNFVRTYIP